MSVWVITEVLLKKKERERETNFRGGPGEGDEKRWREGGNCED